MLRAYFETIEDNNEEFFFNPPPLFKLTWEFAKMSLKIIFGEIVE
jgi:hypothetical protein